MEKIPNLKKVILLDTPSLIYRAFYALPEMTTCDNIPTNAVYGFSLMLLKLLKEENPDYTLAAFDTPHPTFRHKKYTEYKIHRPPTPDKLIKQIPLVKDLLFSFNIKSYEMEGYEADDLIATLVSKLKGEYLHLIISGDFDLLQLVEENIYLVKPLKGITQTIIYTPEKVQEKYNIRPEQIVDFKSLTGDKSDNILGVKGVGEKTAASLLKKFTTVENMIENLSRIDKTDLRHSIFLQQEQIIKNKELITLHRDLPIEIDISAPKVGPDWGKIKSIFQHLQFRMLVEKLDDMMPPRPPLPGQISLW